MEDKIHVRQDRRRIFSFIGIFKDKIKTYANRKNIKTMLKIYILSQNTKTLNQLDNTHSPTTSILLYLARNLKNDPTSTKTFGSQNNACLHFQ